MTRTSFETAEAFAIAQDIGIDFASTAFTLEDFRIGLAVELSHCREHPQVSDDDPVALGRIVYQHLLADPGYYARLLEQDWRRTG